MPPKLFGAPKTQLQTLAVHFYLCCQSVTETAASISENSEGV
jgi:hypothetical protein